MVRRRTLLLSYIVLLFLLVQYAVLAIAATTPDGYIDSNHISSSASLALHNDNNNNNSNNNSNNKNETGGGSHILSRSDILPFHWIGTGAILSLSVLMGLFVSQMGKSSFSSTSAIYYRLFRRTLFSDSTNFTLLNDLIGLTLGEWLMIAGYMSCVILWFFYGFIFERRPHPLLNKFAKGVGYACIFHMACVLLPVTRHSVWTWIFNISYERAVRFHRFIGFATVFFVAVHCVLFSTVFYQKKEFAKLFVWNPNLFQKVNILCGIISFIAMVLMTLLALPVIRRHMWNTFQFCHVIFAIIAFVFAHMHLPYKMTIPFTAAGIVLYAFDVLIRYFSFIGNWHYMMMMRRRSSSADGSDGILNNQFVSVRRCQIRAHDQIGVTTVKLTCDRSLILSSRVTTRTDSEKSHLLSLNQHNNNSNNSSNSNSSNNNNNEDWLLLKQMEEKAQELCLGKFIYLWIWEISAWESHPFSITEVSMPDMSTIELRLDIKETGGSSEAWAGKLNWLASDRENEYVDVMARFDGPFGSLTVPLNHTEGVKQFDLIMLFAGGIGVTAVNALTKYCAARNPHTHLIWVVRSSAHLALLPDLVSMKDHVTAYVTRGGNADSDDYISGRPALEKVIMRHVNNVPNCRNVGVVVCGPVPLVIDLKASCRKVENNTGIHFHIHTECFEL